MNPIYIYDHISLSSSQNDKCFRQICRDKTHALYPTAFIENRVVFEKK